MGTKILEQDIQNQKYTTAGGNGEFLIDKNTVFA